MKSSPAALDHLFNAQVIKGRYTIDKRLRDVLTARYKSTINQLRKQGCPACSSSSPAQTVETPCAESRVVGMRKTLQRRFAQSASTQVEELAMKKSVIAAVDKEEDARYKIKEELPMHLPEKTDALKIKFMNAELNASGKKEAAAGSRTICARS